MESNGVGPRLDGAPVGCDTGPIYWGEPGTNGQHSFYQLIHQGRTCAVRLHRFGRSSTRSASTTTCCWPTSSRRRGAGVRQDRGGLRAEGVPETLVPHKRFEGNRPSNTLLLAELTPANLGKLVALYEHSVFTQGAIAASTSFDQWGVEPVPAGVTGGGRHADRSPRRRRRRRRARRLKSSLSRRAPRCASALLLHCRHGGRTPWRMLHLLAGRRRAVGAGYLFQVDERVAPDGDDARTWTHIAASLFRRAAARGTGARDGRRRRRTRRGGRHYARTLADHAGTPPTLDLVHLSLARRHIGPARPRRRGASRDRRRSRSPRPYLGHRRMTMTYPVLNRARAVLWQSHRCREVRDALCSPTTRPSRPAASMRARRAGAGRRGGGGLSCTPGTPSTASIAAARSSSALPTDLKTVRSMASRRPWFAAREHRQRPAHVSRPKTPRDSGPSRSPLLASASSVSMYSAAPRKQSSSASAHRRGVAADQVEVAARREPAAVHTSGSVASVAQLTMSGGRDGGGEVGSGVGGQFAARQSAARARPVGATRPHRHTRSIARTSRYARAAAARYGRRRRRADGTHPARASAASSRRAAVRRRVISPPSSSANGTPVVASNSV